MPVCVAEYLGQRTDGDFKILPAVKPEMCPFMNAECTKLNQRNKPVCSVRKNDGSFWIVCRDRLCSTKKNIPLADYQKNILKSVAETIFPDTIKPENIIYRRETPINFSSSSKMRSMADYIMCLHDIPNGSSLKCPDKVVLEMQGGGETSNTGNLTKHVDEWERSGSFSSKILGQQVKGVNTLETNAWRRQQEQFLVKGNIALQSKGGMVFCVGPLLFDLLLEKVKKATVSDLRTFGWSLALVSFKELQEYPSKPDSVKLIIDDKRLLFTSYHAFTRALTDQGEPSNTIFTGEFSDFSGKIVTI